MSKPATRDHATPVNEIDAAARSAFGALVRRDGVGTLAAWLGVNPRTVGRIGISRDVPPGMARRLVDYLDPAHCPPPVPAKNHAWAMAFHEWAEFCRQRDARRQGETA